MATTTLDVQVRSQTKWIISGRTDLLWFTLGSAGAAYAFWALWRFVHVPLLLLAAVPINFLLFRSNMPLLGVYAAATIFHNIQYHRLVWFYNQNKYGQETERGRKFGRRRW